MPQPVAIERLSLHLELLPTVASWLRSEWPAWYGPGGNGDADQDANAYARAEHAVPLGLLAFQEGVPVGFGALKNEGAPLESDRRPWAGAGYVLPKVRGQGIGAHLLQALVREASAMGYPHVYCGTSTSSSLLVREGWQRLEVVAHAGEQVVIFQSAA